MQLMAVILKEEQKKKGLLHRTICGKQNVVVYSGRFVAYVKRPIC